ncbi:6-hydroxymethylpterin diphosphokinase MptE-like protein [Lachnoclostridium sp. Marseille-P6806]|uniref:6-hydroxymethylpterin diphosphokinase MptE-like protein n=1 Tax=Lachnoclostridium sp. Marseille-P6806 TaxID=2364793 RepID=UPI0013EEEFAA|nr:6-hydroxymethylpterin diphosphokinase MptE-like protein [Lachnoclostridium sp. Marseille-P6806]
MNLKSCLRKIPGLMQLRNIQLAFHAPLSEQIRSHRVICQYRNLYEGKRCFIIGNGPSLSAEDLDKLRDEITFGFNKIYLIFPKTEWRPTFYCVQDEQVLCGIEDHMLAEVSGRSQATFVRMQSFGKISGRGIRAEKLISVPIWNRISGDGRIRFSKRADRFTYDGSTVSYFALQLAAYMGFREIYLLGVDNNFPYRMKRTGEIVANDTSLKAHFFDGTKDDFARDSLINRSNNYEVVNSAYRSAEAFSRADGNFRIFNATRGGILETFERVDMDEVLRNR